MDRLIALVGLRWRLDLRALRGARERLVGLVLFAPIALLGAALGAVVVFLGVRWVERSWPEALLPGLSAFTTLAGLFWALSPLLVGVAFSETHDMGRLLHFPVPFRTLVVSSVLANLTEPMVVLRLPVMVVLAAALSDGPARFPAAMAGVLVSFAFTLAAAQAVGLLLQGLSRNRRAQDWALFLGVGLGFLLSLLPLLFITGRLSPLVRLVLERDPFALSPFAWGVRAAVHGGHGEALPFLAFLGSGGAGVAAAMAVSAALARRIYRGEVVLGGSAAPAAAARSRRLLLPGALGALLEKDLRITWRDPRLRAAIFTGLLGPLFLLFVLWPRGMGGASATALLLLASFTGMAAFGSNAFALERRGLILLLGFPVERWKILVAKNAVATLLRLPALALLAAATVLLGAPALLVPVLTVALVTLLIAAGADNFLSILFPIPVPAPGANPYGSVSGGRGLGAAAVAAVLLAGALVLSSPFAFLVWLPLLLGARWLWVVSLPLALAGAAGAYAMLVSAAGSLLEKREPSLIARVLAEE